VDVRPGDEPRGREINHMSRGVIAVTGKVAKPSTGPKEHDAFMELAKKGAAKGGQYHNRVAKVREKFDWEGERTRLGKSVTRKNSPSKFRKKGGGGKRKRRTKRRPRIRNDPDVSQRGAPVVSG